MQSSPNRREPRRAKKEARPPVRRTGRIEIRLTPAEAVQINQRKPRDMRLAEFVRRSALGEL